MTINQARRATAKPMRAPIIHFFALSTHVLSQVIPLWICIWIAWYMRATIAIVHATPRRNFIIPVIARAMSYISTFHVLRSVFVISPLKTLSDKFVPSGPDDPPEIHVAAFVQVQFRSADPAFISSQKVTKPPPITTRVSRVDVKIPLIYFIENTIYTSSIQHSEEKTKYYLWFCFSQSFSYTLRDWNLIPIIEKTWKLRFPGYLSMHPFRVSQEKDLSSLSLMNTLFIQLR